MLYWQHYFNSRFAVNSKVLLNTFYIKISIILDKILGKLDQNW